MRAFLFFLFSIAFVSRSHFAAASDSPSPLVTRIHLDVRPAFLSGFHRVSVDPTAPQDPTNPREVSSKIRVLPDSPRGAIRYDVLAYLQDHALPRRPGQIAVYLQNERALIVRGTAEDQKQVSELLDSGDMRGIRVPYVELSLSSWTYLDDPIALAGKHPATFEHVRAAAGDTLRPVDSLVIVTRSGNRATSAHQHADAAEVNLKDAAKAAPEKLPPLRTPGSIAVIEPVIGPTGDTVDFELDYRVRIPQSGGPDLCLEHRTNAVLASGRNAVLQGFLLPSVDGEDVSKVRRCVIVAHLRILSTADQQTPKPAGAQAQPSDQEIIADALNGLPNTTHTPAPGTQPAPK